MIFKKSVLLFNFSETQSAKFDGCRERVNHQVCLERLALRYAHTAATAHYESYRALLVA